MVKALHAAGIEVILDVVYNHTGEGGPDGPDAVASAASTTLGYYRLATDRAPYVDVTGCGNTLDLRQPARRCGWSLDSLRYWVHRDARRRLPLRPRQRRSPATGNDVDPRQRRSSPPIQQDPVLCARSS